MKQRTSSETPDHVAIIMDGNGRWALARGRPRAAGHRAGARAVRRVVEAAPELGIGTLTLYAFSSDNWSRPASEVEALMHLLQVYLRSETARCVEQGVRVSVIGRRDRLPGPLAAAITGTERATSAGRLLHLRLAIDYSSQGAIACAAAAWRGKRPPTDEEFGALLGRSMNEAAASPDVDLLIRTGGEQRLSDFLLWECAYAELYFTPVPWPEFDGAALAAAVGEFRGRERRFGRVQEGGAVAAGGQV